MCLVEVEKAPKLMPACYTTVAEGMVVLTKSDKVIRARKAVLEFLLLNHPVDCPICDQAGECTLQNLYFEYSAQESRLKTRKVNKVKAFPIGPEVVYDGERCVLCTRCVRFCEQITKTNELTTTQRADMTEIRPFPGRELDNDYSQCTVDLCPVGALTSRNFRFKCRVWYLDTTESICTGCARGCSTYLEHFRGEVQRFRPRTNPEINSYWMCDHGRRLYREPHEDRLLNPFIKGVGAVPRNKGLAEAVKRLKAFRDAGRANKLAVVLSPQGSNEGLFSLIRFALKYGVERFYMNGKPDTAFTLRNEPDKVADDFLIVADKNPNTTGLRRLAEAFGITVLSAASLAADLESKKVDSAFILGANFPLDLDKKSKLWQKLEDADLVIFLGQRATPFTTLAHVSLPSCSFAEKQGSYINIDGIRQVAKAAFEPHGLSQPDWKWIERLSLRLQLGWEYENFEDLEAAANAKLAAPPAKELEEDKNAPAQT